MSKQYETYRNCEKCGKTFYGVLTRKFCSKECSLKTRNCGFCGKEFIGHFNKRYCSMKCKDAFKVRKPTGKTLKCVCCGKEFIETHSSKRLKHKVCSVFCSNVFNSKAKRYISLDDIKSVVRDLKIEPTTKVVADTLNTSHTTVMSRVLKEYLTFSDFVKDVRGTYTDFDFLAQSKSAKHVFQVIDTLGYVGVREKAFDKLRNPQTNCLLRIDYFIEEIPLAVEFHGVQHYKSNDFFYNNDRKYYYSFESQKYRDSLKENFLKQNSIPLVIFNDKDDLSEKGIKQKVIKYFND